MSCISSKTRKKDCERWWKSASRTGRTGNSCWTAPAIDTFGADGIHSIFNLQAREAGKAVRFGRGPATVIGVSRQPGYPPEPQKRAFFARGNAGGKPQEVSWGFFVEERTSFEERSRSSSAQSDAVRPG